MEINELDVVRLKDGREGTVLMDFDGEAYEIEFDESTETIKANEIEAVIWRPAKK